MEVNEICFFLIQKVTPPQMQVFIEQTNITESQSFQHNNQQQSLQHNTTTNQAASSSFGWLE
jgi:hypothetical protein